MGEVAAFICGGVTVFLAVCVWAVWYFKDMWR
jgi:hypothetical protein